MRANDVIQRLTVMLLFQYSILNFFRADF